MGVLGGLGVLYTYTIAHRSDISMIVKKQTGYATFLQCAISVTER